MGYDIRIALTETFTLTQDRVQRWARVNTATKARVRQEAGIFSPAKRRSSFLHGLGLLRIIKSYLNAEFLSLEAT